MDVKVQVLHPCIDCLHAMYAILHFVFVPWILSSSAAASPHALITTPGSGLPTGSHLLVAQAQGVPPRPRHRRLDRPVDQTEKEVTRCHFLLPMNKTWS